MKARSMLLSALALVVALLFAVQASPAAYAQQTTRVVPPLYNPATEITVTGTVASVSQVTGRGGSGGTHFQLKTGQETLDVHAGPSSFLASHNFAIAEGDQITVTGSKIRYNESDALLARTLKKGDSEITLRNPQGIPAWSRGRRF